MMGRGCFSFAGVGRMYVLGVVWWWVGGDMSCAGRRIEMGMWDFLCGYGDGMDFGLFW